jgi:hypothetical protein
MAGRAVEAAITQKPIDQALLLGAAQSIPFALGQSADFKKLPQPVQSVLTSTAQAAVLGQDVPEAALTALVQSTGIVSKAISQSPELAKAIEKDPNFARYVVGAANSALVAKVLDRDVSDAVVASLARTTGEIMAQKMQDKSLKDDLYFAGNQHREFEAMKARTDEAAEKVNSLVAANKQDIQNFTAYQNRYNSINKDYSLYQRRADQHNKDLNDPEWHKYIAMNQHVWDYYGEDKIAQKQKLVADNQAMADALRPDLNQAINDYNASWQTLEDKGFWDEYNAAKGQFDAYNTELEAVWKMTEPYYDLIAEEGMEIYNLTEDALVTAIQAIDPREMIGEDLSKSDVAVQAYLESITSGAPLSVAYQAAENAFQRDQDYTERRDRLVSSGVDVNQPMWMNNSVTITPDLVQTDAEGNKTKLTPEEFERITGSDYNQMVAGFTAARDKSSPLFDASTGGTKTYDWGNRSIREYSDGDVYYIDSAYPQGRKMSYQEYELVTGSKHRNAPYSIIEVGYGDPALEKLIGAVAQTPTTDSDLLSKIEEVAARPDIELPKDPYQLVQATTPGGEQMLPPIVVTPDISKLVAPTIGETMYKEEQNVVIRPDPNLPPEGQFEPFEVSYRYVNGYKSDGTPYRYMIEYSPMYGITYYDIENAGEIITERQAESDRVTGFDSSGVIRSNVPATLPPIDSGTGAGTGTGTGAGTGTGTGATGAGTGAPPPVDSSPVAETTTPPSYTTLFNFLTSGEGGPEGQNRAIFNPAGGMGAGNPQETTWSLVARASQTGTNDVVDVGGKIYSLLLLPDRQVLVPKTPEPVPTYIELYQDPATKTTVMQEVDASKAPPDIAKEIAKKEGETSGGAAAGAEGSAGGREGTPGDATPSPGTQVSEPSTTTPQADLTTPEIAGTPTTTPSVPQTSGTTSTSTTTGPSTDTGSNLPLTTTPAPEVPTAQPSAPPSSPTSTAGEPGTPSGSPTGTGAPSAGGFGTGEQPGGGESGTVPGGGEGTGTPGGTGEGTARGDEGTGTGTGTEGEGIGTGGTGTGTGEGEGEGTGEGGGTPVTTSSSRTFMNMLGLGALGAAAASGDYKPTTPGETWLGGLFRTAPDTTAGFRRLLGLEPEAQEASVYSALQRASGVPDNLASPASFYSYGKETSPADTFKFYRRGGTVQDDPPSDKMPMSPLLMSHGDIPHKGSHYVNGAGGGQDDLIPAQLADGEYVLDAEIVAALGDGSSKEGAKKLDKFREAIRRHKRSGSLKDIPPKAKSPLAYLRSVK